jgi:cation transport ATPase
VSLRPVVRRILLAGVLLLLVVVAWGTLSGGLRQIPLSRTIGQRLETFVQLLCGLLSLLGVLTSFRWRRWSARVLAAWAVTFAATAGLSTIVWGPPMLLVGLVATALALLAALAIIRILRALSPPS